MCPAAITLSAEHPLTGPVRDFLADLEFAGRSAQTIRAYRGDLAQLAQHTDRGRPVSTPVRSWSTAIAELAPTSRARKQAAVAAFLRSRVRDRLLFEFLKSTGCRVGEALGIHLEDLDLAPGNEHVLVHGKAAGSGSCCWRSSAWSTCCAGSCARPATATGRCSGPNGTGPAGR